MLADFAGALAVLRNPALTPTDAAVALIVAAWYFEAEAEGRPKGDWRRISFDGEHGIALSVGLKPKAVGAAVKRLAEMGLFERLAIGKVKTAKGFDSPVRIRFTQTTLDAAIIAMGAASPPRPTRKPRTVRSPCAEHHLTRCPDCGVPVTLPLDG